MPTEPILRIAVPAPLRHALDYLPPENSRSQQFQPGMRAVVPLGSRRVVGVIMEVASDTEFDATKLKRVVDIPDAEPVLPPDILQLGRWAAQYYHAMLGEAVVNTLPVALRDGKHRNRVAALEWQPTSLGAGLSGTALNRAPQQADALRILLARGAVPAAECRALGIANATLKALQHKGLAISRPIEDSIGPPAVIAPSHSPPALNDAQAHALEVLENGIGRFGCVLLEGVTGSGKTEVYLRLIERVLARQQQALVLVPEIGLTPQTERRFAARFGERIAVMHSGLGDAARLRAWEHGASGRARVVIGTRSALFSPLPELGVIIVDEEHDASFKQQEGLRYSARDLAVYRARLRDIPIVLGSATPSPESIANCQSGRFSLLSLPERAGTAKPPEVQLLDVRRLDLEGGMSETLLQRIAEELGAGNQVLVFLNRRGWAPLFTCSDCGWMASCRDCDARLTVHRDRELLWCHHCDYRIRLPTACPGCGSASLLALGTGTERSEHTLQRRFAGYAIHRIDSGTMQTRNAMEKLIAEIERGEPCILVGTQMLAKGHHFPGVTLVAIVDLDAGLFSADYRAAERTGQLLVQVAGRAGRADRPGQVIVQTLHPTHPWLLRLVHSGYRAFIDPILDARKLRGLPPHAHLALLRAESRNPDDAQRALQDLKQLLLARHPGVSILGPVPAAMPRRAGLHRVHLLIKHHMRAPLHAALDTVCRSLDAQRPPGVDRWSIDVDPLESA
jgi:primosomal protein N' (replication factor Y) (superfamily II helicase)